MTLRSHRNSSYGRGLHYKINSVSASLKQPVPLRCAVARTVQRSTADGQSNVRNLLCCTYCSLTQGSGRVATTERDTAHRNYVRRTSQQRDLHRQLHRNLRRQRTGGTPRIIEINVEQRSDIKPEEHQELILVRTQKTEPEVSFVAAC